MRTYITTLLLATTLILASCGGGNDIASSGASAVSAAAPVTTNDATTTASTPATTATEPKINGQVDERTGVAPVIAKANLGHQYCVTCSSCHVPMDRNLSFCPPRTN